MAEDARYRMRGMELWSGGVMDPRADGPTPLRPSGFAGQAG